MKTFEQIKAEADKQLREKNLKLRNSEEWKKSQEMKEKWIETIKRQQETALKNK